MSSSLVVPFPGTAKATAAEVGGKGHALMRMVETGLPVPPGAVLTASFFSPWFDEIRASATWNELATAAPERWGALCAELRERCPALGLTAAQREALHELRATLAAQGNGSLYAVRSSSPEEDTATASFAGGYETRLGVRREGLEDAVRACFASSLDERVLVYKKQHGMDSLSPRIAVVVQRQVASEVAGVGFSINPVTNDYDEVVVDANWGLGESVVAGLASPDHFVVEKVDRRVLERARGDKQVSIWLGADGGTVRREGYRAGELTLDDARLAEVAALICRVEALLDVPVDVEWAYDGGRLHLLQARPVTAWVPLPAEMITPPGRRRVLYTDIALSSGLTINAPISPMGLDWMEEGAACLVEMFFGSLNLQLTFEQKWWLFAGGRMYQNLSNVLWLVSPQKLARTSATTDALMAEILAGIDRERYQSAERPPWARLRMLRFVPRFLWRVRGFFWRTLWAIMAPRRASRAYRREVEGCNAWLTEQLDGGLPLDEFRKAYTAPMMRHLFRVTMPALAAGLAAMALIDRVVGRKLARTVADPETLKLGYGGNVVAEMGIEMFRMARMLDPSDFEDLPALVEQVRQRRMPAAFMTAWDAFMSTYGWRGPDEMDLASPRYADDPALALRQMSFMTVDDEDFDPQAAHRRLVAERRRAYEALMERAGWLRRALLRRVHRVMDLFAGTRDTPKHQNLLFYHAVRQRVLIEGRRLVQAGRLDAPEHIFDLTFGDVRTAAGDPALDLRALRGQRTRFLELLRAHVTRFPPVIDSRGRILSPAPRDESAGELRGMAVSPGVARGPVNVMHNPHDKPVNKGDVLVAYATDPGWTPLFANAVAVVLEVGGVLQHGAVVAREYGKPCVSGIDRLLSKLRDGQMVEVDGAAGIVRLLSEPGLEEP